ncbi:hypothetical protein OPQ81_006532 [Rhizoctonia solani]|nr:hypothetical protein OPQ81_006532 [Rhizoctonia solani]
MDNIWDDDAVQVSHKGPSRTRVLSDSDEEDRPQKRARTTGANKPLFNPESDDDEGAGTDLPPDVGALFDGLDDNDYDMQQLPPQLNIEALQRESDQRVAVEAAKKRLARGDVMDVSGPTDGDGKGAKARKILPKLDEQRLLDRDGMPALVRRAKEFKIKGKGHELSDLNRLMQMYQLWAHKMFPKMQFQDTVERVEKLCRTKRMHVALSTWRDIDKAPGPGDDDLEADAEEEVHSGVQPDGGSATSTYIISCANGEPDEDEEEMWRDMMEAMEAQNQEKEKEQEAQKQKAAGGGKQPEDEYGGAFNEEDWAIMDEVEQEADKAKKPSGLGANKVQSTLPPSSPPWTDHEVSSDAPPEPAGPSDDEDDFYAMYEP